MLTVSSFVSLFFWHCPLSPTHITVGVCIVFSRSPPTFPIPGLEAPRFSSMASDKGRPLPKFGEWDVNNPATSEGFTVIFNKARNEKKTNGTAVTVVTPRKSDTDDMDEKDQIPKKRKWLCCGVV
ncbi:protein NOI4 [Prosopis cineraria]|uniref:protein NOI4 n=1 Tax=Prosopis cineraria TaxID=364024 RepID=UPI00240EBCC7|nr:protein NOI4 [Prosopis cineraria]